jgi:hypothetical protein
MTAYLHPGARLFSKESGEDSASELLQAAVENFRRRKSYYCHDEACRTDRKIQHSGTYAGYVVIGGECGHARAYEVQGVPHEEGVNFRWRKGRLVIDYGNKKCTQRNIPSYMTQPGRRPTLSKIETLAS